MHEVGRLAGAAGHLDDEPGPGVPACRRLFRKLAAGVTVITSCEPGGVPVGMTASAMTSLSLRPPLLLVCLSNGSRTLAAIRRHRVFAVHVLREDQRALAEAFANSRIQPSTKFGRVGWRPVLGAPTIPDSLAWAVCLLHDDRVYGDHSLIVGRVSATHASVGRPLVWHDGGFCNAPQTHAPQTRPPDVLPPGLPAVGPLMARAAS